MLIQKIPQRTQSPSGILFCPKPDFLDDEKQWRVIAVGWGKIVTNKRTKQKHHVPIEVVPGDRVLVDTAKIGVIHLDDGRALVDADTIEMKW